MNWAQLKDPVSYMCLVGAVGVSWSLTQGVGWVADSSPFTVIHDKYKFNFIQILSLQERH